MDINNIEEQPIANVKWVDPKFLRANHYNPNVVVNQELRLLEFSIKQNGWIQPILCDKKGVIIDGFHRAQIAKKNNWKAPVAVLDISEPERMLLTIRINRAKGTHVAVRMSDIIKKLIYEFNYTPEQISQGIGASKAEIDVLLREDVFEHLRVDEIPYSEAWQPSR